MFDIPIDELTPAHIHQLVVDRTFESQHLEFKRQLPVFDNAESVATMCGDIAAFGNASGGYLIYGVDEARGDPDSANCAAAILDTSVENEDRLVQRMSQIVQAGIEPRGFGVRIRVITCEDGKKVVVVRVHESFRKPLRAKHSGKWFIRINNQNSSMEYHQIQDLFLNSDRLSERIRNFRDERISAILSNDSIAPFEYEKLIVYHFIPKMAFEGEFEADLDVYRNLALPRCNGINGLKRSTMDGIAFFGMSAGYTDTLLSKTEIFRSGVIEMVDAYTLHNDRELNLGITEEAIAKTISEGVAAMKQIKVTCRISFFMTILNIGGTRLWTDPRDPRQREYRVSRRNLDFPEYVLEPDQAIDPMIDATLRRLRNAFGL